MSKLFADGTYSYNKGQMEAHSILDTDFRLPGQTNVYHGKVRDMYTIGSDYIVAVATDRISAFDVILPEPIPFKGMLLNQMAAHFLEATADIAPNWLINVPDPNVSIGYKCEPIKLEMVIRGLLIGHAWREYQDGKRELCGETMPDGMQEYDAFPEPIITPATKADEGHDEDISGKQAVKQGIVTQKQWDELAGLTRKLFARGQAMARERGLILADTKYEFGVRDGKFYVIDEIHTADSSRYFYADSYEAFLKDRSGERPKHLSKEFVREWLMEHGFSGQAGQKVPDLPEDFIASISARYAELYEQLTGRKFEKPPASDHPVKRIESNILKALEELK